MRVALESTEFRECPWKSMSIHREPIWHPPNIHRRFRKQRTSTEGPGGKSHKKSQRKSTSQWRSIENHPKSKLHLIATLSISISISISDRCNTLRGIVEFNPDKTDFATASTVVERVPKPSRDYTPICPSDFWYMIVVRWSLHYSAPCFTWQCTFVSSGSICFGVVSRPLSRSPARGLNQKSITTIHEHPPNIHKASAEIHWDHMAIRNQRKSTEGSPGAKSPEVKPTEINKSMKAQRKSPEI